MPVYAFFIYLLLFVYLMARVSGNDYLYGGCLCGAKRGGKHAKDCRFGDKD